MPRTGWRRVKALQAACFRVLTSIAGGDSGWAMVPRKRTLHRTFVSRAAHFVAA